jgi:hypothetical protein
LSGELIFSLEQFSSGLSGAREKIEAMSDEQLIELYSKLKSLEGVSWVIRCVVLGVAKTRAKRGDGVITSLAVEFGISQRMAQYDIAVYETFIRDNPTFEPVLTPKFYQLALKAENPNGAINYAIDRFTAGRYSAEEFRRTIGGRLPREPFPKGFYRCVPMEAGAIDVEERTELHGKFIGITSNGELFVEVQ